MSDSSDSEEDVAWMDVELEAPTEPEQVEVVIDGQTALDGVPDAAAEERKKKQRQQRRTKLLRLTGHLLHLNYLLDHGLCRNEWINDRKLQHELKKLVPKPLRVAIKSCIAGKKTIALAELLTKLVVFFRGKFAVVRPGIRRFGYCHDEALLMEQCQDSELFLDLRDFRKQALTLRGSRDFGAQIFVSIVRALGLEARLVFSPTVLGFSLLKSDSFKPRPIHGLAKTPSATTKPEDSTGGRSNEGSESPGLQPDEVYVPEISVTVDSDLAFPTFWCEVFDSESNSFIPVDPMVLPELVGDPVSKPTAFEPIGPFAGSQKMYYVVGYESNGNCRDLTAKYMTAKTMPRLLSSGFASQQLIQLLALPREVGYAYFAGYVRKHIRVAATSAALEAEDARMREWALERESSDEVPEFPSTLAGYKNHPSLVLESQLTQSQALVLGAKAVHTFEITTRGKGKRTESVYNQTDVVLCRSRAAWFKEGRDIKQGEIPLISEGSKPSTKQGKRKLAAREKYGMINEEDEQDLGLYSRAQTVEYKPPPIVDGIIPRNSYGRIECFTPNMVPEGAVHLRVPGLPKIAKKLGIDCVPAIVGFRFKSRYAKPEIDGAVVVRENAEVLMDAWREEQRIQSEHEAQTRSDEALDRWKLYLARLRLLNRLKSSYG